MQSFSEHIRELRRRALWVGLAFVVASGVAYQFHDILVQLVMRPLGEQKLIYLTPGGGFSFIFQITLYAGLMVAAPTVMYQLYAFVRPALPLSARRSAAKVVVAAVALMLAGASYGYFVAVPAALQFLSAFAGSEVLPSLTAESYLSFFLAYVAGLGLLFQLPLLLLFWHWINPMTPGGLLKAERLVIILAFVAAALITPTPDVVNQAMIAGPLILVFQLGAVVVLWQILRARKRKTQPAPAAAAQVVMPTPQPQSQLIAFPQQTTTPQPVSSRQQYARPRDIDGFGVRRPVSTVRSRTMPSRSSAASIERPSRPLPTMPRRSSLVRIDGISPV